VAYTSQGGKDSDQLSIKIVMAMQQVLLIETLQNHQYGNVNTLKQHIRFQKS
jgi:hypothetical protein